MTEAQFSITFDLHEPVFAQLLAYCRLDTWAMEVQAAPLPGESDTTSWRHHRGNPYIGE